MDPRDVRDIMRVVSKHMRAYSDGTLHEKECIIFDPPVSATHEALCNCIHAIYRAQSNERRKEGE